MNRFVVDASVAIKWAVPEIHSTEALRYLDPSLERHAPELWLAEIANILWKKTRRGEIPPDQAALIADGFRGVKVEIHSMRDLFCPALAIAEASGCSAYDSMYLALADHLAIPLVTADRRLFNSLQSGPFARLVVWVEDEP